MVVLIVVEKYETLKNLYTYDIEDVLDLFEIVLVKTLNTRIMTERNQR